LGLLSGTHIKGALQVRRYRLLGAAFKDAGRVKDLTEIVVSLPPATAAVIREKCGGGPHQFGVALLQ